MRKHNPADNGVHLPFNEVEFAEKWGEWLLERRERRYKSYTVRGLKQCFKNLLEISGGDVKVAIKIIDQSIGQGWQGLFNLRQQNSNGYGNQAPITNAGIKDAVINFVNGGK